MYSDSPGEQEIVLKKVRNVEKALGSASLVSCIAASLFSGLQYLSWHGQADQCIISDLAAGAF